MRSLPGPVAVPPTRNRRLLSQHYGRSVLETKTGVRDQRSITKEKREGRRSRRGLYEQQPATRRSRPRSFETRRIVCLSRNLVRDPLFGVPTLLSRRFRPGMAKGMEPRRVVARRLGGLGEPQTIVERDDGKLRRKRRARNLSKLFRETPICAVVKNMDTLNRNILPCHNITPGEKNGHLITNEKRSHSTK